jgi:hypothetical protein
LLFEGLEKSVTFPFLASSRCCSGLGVRGEVSTPPVFATFAICSGPGNQLFEGLVDSRLFIGLDRVFAQSPHLIMPVFFNCLFGPPDIERSGLGKVNLAVDRLFVTGQKFFVKTNFL